MQPYSTSIALRIRAASQSDADKIAQAGADHLRETFNDNDSIAMAYAEPFRPTGKPEFDAQALRYYFDHEGIKFADCKRAFATPNDHPAIVKARAEFHVDGEVEFDDDTLISESDDAGEYVLAWVWIPLPADESAD